MRPRLSFDSLRRIRGPALWIGYGVAAIALGAGGMYLVGQLRGPGAAPDEAAAHGEHEGHDDHGEHEGEPAGTIHFPRQKQKAAGVRVEPARRADLAETVRITGKVALNEDRVTRLHPLVEGRVHEVHVQFGDRVKQGQVLAVIDSQQVGRAKLELYKSRRETRLAQVNCDWQKTVYENTLALIDALQEGMPITEIEDRFRNKPMGEYRDRLLTTYADLHKARADYQRLAEVTERGIVAAKQMLAATAARDAAQAKFAGDLEQIRFLAERNKIAAEQELEKARTTEAVNRELLVILGYKDIQDEEIDPAIQREAISHYEVKAPFDGTVISKDIVLMDQVDPGTQMFSIADFSTVWVKADVYEKHLPLLASLADDTVRFHADAYPDRHFEANVFYTGNIVDEKTRTADLRAIADNTDGLLKPGMFVQIDLPGSVVPNVLQVPRTAVAEEEGETFVFIQKGEEQFERRDVKVRRSAGEVVEIVEGLQPGERVAVAGLFALKTAAQGEVAHAHAH